MLYILKYLLPTPGEQLQPTVAGRSAQVHLVERLDFAVLPLLGARLHSRALVFLDQLSRVQRQVSSSS